MQQIVYYLSVCKMIIVIIVAAAAVVAAAATVGPVAQSV